MKHNRDERVLLDDPLIFIKKCVQEKRILWTYHVNMQMKGRLISREMIIASFDNFEIIEAYPYDKYLPSYLVYSKQGNIIFHVLFAVDVLNENMRIVTAYFPNKDKWDVSYKRRKKS